MILEHAILEVKKGLEKEFEADFKLASKYISSVDGYITHQLQKCMEQPHKYLLLVKWETLEAHTIGFRQSEEYQEWRKILHNYYEPFPVVEHFELVYKNELA